MIFGYPASYGHYASEVLPLEYMFGAVSRPIHRVQDLQGIQFLVLFGGEDISTYWYKEPPVKAHASATPSQREKTEAIIVEECFKNNIPILGICRGAQFMCAFLGGGLWQHVDNHAVGDYGHEMIFEGKIYRTNSYHHYRPSKVAFLAQAAWGARRNGSWPETVPERERREYDLATIRRWLEVFVQRFFQGSQFKRSAMPNGPKVGSRRFAVAARRLARAERLAGDGVAR